MKLKSGKCSIKETAANEEEASATPRTSAVNVLDYLTINVGYLLKDEALLWLNKIYRRLAGRRSIRQPFQCEISRDIPLEIFKSLVRAIKFSKSPDFQEPHCFFACNKKGEVVSITCPHVLARLFSWLTGKGITEVKSYFQRTLKGNRKDHRVRVLVSPNKDFGIVYSYKKGQLIIQYHYGEWNSFGFPQHSCQLQDFDDEQCQG